MEFNKVYNRISPRLRRIAFIHRNRCSGIDEKDLYQEMSVYLWRNFKDRDESEVNDYYMVKGCEFHIMNYIRTHKDKVRLCRLETPINENGSELKDMIAGPAEDTARVVDRKLTIDTIMNNGFTRREKDVLSLLLKGYTVREAGERLGVSHVMIVKARKSLIEKWIKKEKRLPGD